MTSSPEARLPLARAALVWTLLVVLIMLVNAGNIAAGRFPDPDDSLRLVQVRDLLAGQSWFDLRQYRMAPPDGTLMHWSRMVDLPLAAGIAALTPLLGIAAAETATLIAVPLLTLGVVLLVVAYLASRFFDREVTTFACLALGLSPLFVAQIQPLRIDHHGWQVASVMIAMIGLLPGRGWRGAALAGTAFAAGVLISLEVLPLMAGFGAVFAFRWLIDRDNRSLPAFLVTLTGAAAVLFVGTRGLGDLAMHCDAISPAHLAALALTSVLVVGAARSSPCSLVVTLAMLGVAAVAGGATYLSLAPRCVAGPFGNLDPLVRHFWYDNVLEGRPIWVVPPLLAVPAVASGAIALAVLVHLARTRPDCERRWWWEYLAVSGGAVIGALLVWRSQAFVGALAALPLGWLAVQLIVRMRAAANPFRKLAAALIAALVLLPGFPTALAGVLAQDDELDTGRAGKVTESTCALPKSAARLNALPAGIIFAPLDIGPDLLAQSHHSVIATGHHRGEPAMRDVIAVFTSPAGEAQPIVARRAADYLVLCTDLSEARSYAQAAPGGLASLLRQGHAPAWLERLNPGVPEAMQVWRVRPPAP